MALVRALLVPLHSLAMVVSAGLRFFCRSFRYCAGKGLDLVFGPTESYDYVSTTARIDHYRT